MCPVTNFYWNTYIYIYSYVCQASAAAAGRGDAAIAGDVLLVSEEAGDAGCEACGTGVYTAGASTSMQARACQD